MTHTIERYRNGVDTEQLYGTLDAIKAQPELGTFQFRARNHWIDGAHNRTTIQSFYGAGQEDATPAPTRRSTCCTRSPPASRHRSSTSPLRAGCG
jgi:hypothetical protein